MITLHDPIRNELNVNDDIDRNIKKLCELLNYDIATVVNFQDENKFVVSRRIFAKKDDKYIKLNKQWITVAEKSSHNILNLVRNKKQVIIYTRDNDENEYLPLTENALIEIYIPICTDKKNNEDDDSEVIYCIYLASFDEDKTVKIDRIINGEVYDVICTLERLYQIVYFKPQIKNSDLNLINMMPKITREKDQLISHLYHVAQLSSEIGKELNLDKKAIEKIYFAGILHDIGKSYLDRNILNKIGPLTEEEYKVLNNHSVYGDNIVKYVSGLEELALFARHHHERYDGTGYPNGLKGEEIPLESRIICIADAVDEMFSHRSYRTTKNVDYVIAELLKNKGRKFDPKIVDIMVNILTKNKEEIIDVFSESIVWSTLIINTTKKVYSIEGTLGKYNFGHFFKAEKFNFLSEINQADITNISLYINKKNNVITQYQIKVDHFEENMVHISSLKYVPLMDSYSILWDLVGELHLDNANILPIKIYKIGGSTLMFCLDEKQIKEYMKDGVLSLKIYFKDKKSVIVNGKITKSLRMNKSNYYEFTYLNIRESIKDEIFKQIFIRETRIKGLINKVI